MISKIKRLIKKYFVVKKIIPTEIPIYRENLLNDKKALIFGGSGGIGSEIAKAFVQSGGKVMLVGTNEQKLIDLCNQLDSRKTDYVIADIKKVDEINKAIDKTIQQFGRIDIFVHSAGVHCHDKFGEVTEQTWENVTHVNLKSMYLACQNVSIHMIKNNIKGHILNVSSASSAKPGWTPYEISKNAVKALTLGFADKLVKHGIVVNAIAPGPVATPMLNKTDNDISWQGNPTGRMSTPAEIANWAVFMASDLGNMVIGDTFFVSGGSGTICLDK